MAADPRFRDFTDTATTRKMILDHAIGSLGESFNQEDDTHRMELIGKPRFSGPTSFTMQQQKDALMKGRSLATPISGTVRLTDKRTGKVLDEKEELLLHVPYYTERGTMINDGTEYAIANQMRLKPGVYTRRRQSGEVEAQLNTKTGSGPGLKLWMEPSTGVFRANVGSANIPLLTMTRSMGIPDASMERTMGSELYAANDAKAQDKRAQDRLARALLGYKYNPDDPAANQTQLLATYDKMRFDPSVMKRTLGLDHEGLTPEVLHRTTQKLLAINRGEEEEDDRDAPEFGHLMGVEDFVKERISRDSGNLRRTLMWTAKRNGNLGALRRGHFSPYLRSMLLSAGYASPIEETNPFQMIDQQSRISKLGEGGIPSVDVVTMEARDVKPGQVGFIDLVAGPESENAGIDVRASYKTFKGHDGALYAEFRDKAGQTTHLRPEDMRGKTVAFPEQEDQQVVTALRDGKMVHVKADEVDYHVPSQAHMYFGGFNLSPMATSFQPGRAFYASKYWSQFMPLASGEAPLVRSTAPDGRSFVNIFGRQSATLSAPADGKVTKVAPTGVTIQAADGKEHFVETVQNLPFNRITGMSYKSAVKPGDVVKSGDLVATSNFTDGEGNFAMGRNLKTAIIPYKGHSHEDAYHLSESAAKKLATERLFGFDQRTSGGMNVGKSKFISLFPNHFTTEQLDNIDEETGVARPGSIVRKGDPLILASQPKSLSTKDSALGNLHKALRKSWRNEAVTWEMDAPGIVTDMGRGGGAVRLNVKSVQPVQVGDKLSNLNASKGIVGKISPDAEMPIDPATGEPYDMTFNPMAVQSRVAPNQLMETWLGKVAKKTGQPVMLPSARPKEGWLAWTKAKLAEHGLSAESNLHDPLDGEIKSVSDGYMYIAPFHHLAEKKIGTRSAGGGYDAEEQPTRGGEDAAKRVSNMNTNALLAHGALEVLKDSHLVRGAKNDDFWNAMRLGRPLPEPKQPLIFRKFDATLKAGGIRMHRKGDALHIMPMMDRDVDELGAREVTSSSTVDAKDLSPIKGGLFDEEIFGGAHGSRWGYIPLNEPLPNPVMEEPIRRLLGLKVKDYAEVLAGRQKLPNGDTGGGGIKGALAALDLPSELARAKEEIGRTRGANRDDAVKRLRYLSNFTKQGINPGDMVLTKIPVLPPAFRPVSQVGDMIRAADMNGLYRDIIEVNHAVGDIRGQLGHAAAGDEVLDLYRSVEAAYGLGSPLSPDGQAKGWKGAIRQVVGTSPKYGMLQRKLLSKNVDLAARGVISPDPELDMDTVGIPDDHAWEIFKPMIQGELVKRGIPPTTAVKMVADRSKEADAALDKVMGSRPVILDRAPTWHKFNFMAFMAHRVKDKSIHLSPLVLGGFNADHDGDAMTVHVPATEKAAKEAWDKMRASVNLVSLTDRRSMRHTIGKEMMLGLWRATNGKPSAAPPRSFASAEDVRKALARGEIGYDDPVIIEDEDEVKGA